MTNTEEQCVKETFDSAGKENRMEASYKNTILLLKSALTGQGQILPNDFSMEEIINITRNQQCDYLIYAGALCCGISSAAPELQQLQERALMLAATNAQQMYEVEAVFSAFRENKIKFLPLKGSVIKNLYPQQEMRTMSDADILISLEQKEKIAEIMKNLGFAFSLESNHELVWEKSTLYIELHKSLFPSYFANAQVIYADSWCHAKPIAAGSSEYKMEPEELLLYLFTHFAKHYKDGGIGLRHLIDLWVVRTCYPNIDNEAVHSQLKKLHLDVFYENVMRTLSVWFEDACEDAITDQITNSVFNSGAFGSGKLRRIGAAVAQTSKLKAPSQLRRIVFWKLLFPPYQLMKRDYPVLKKLPFLLPFIWLIRAFKAVFIKKSVATQKKRLDALTQEKVDDYSKNLAQVGLSLFYDCE